MNYKLFDVKKIKVLSLIILIVITETFAQYNIRKSTNTMNNLYLLIGILSYGLICYLLSHGYKYNEIGKMNVLWSILSMISILLIGIIIFHEQVNIYDIIGLVLSIIGFYFIFIKGH